MDLEQWPSLLSMVVPPLHNTWIDRGLAPFVYQEAALPGRCAVVTEIEVKGEPIAVVAGPIVFDPALDNYVCQIGIRREETQWIILFQSPGETHAQAAVESGHVYLKLERDGGDYTAFVRSSPDAPWSLVGEARGIGPTGPSEADLRAGVLTKSCQYATATLDYRNFEVQPVEDSAP